jgi:hypothetical protein
MMTKSVRSRFNHEVGGRVEGCTILEKRVVIPPDPVERRLGVYDYVVEVPPAPPAPAGKSRTSSKPSSSAVAAPGSFTRTTPDKVGTVIRRVPSR